MATCLKDFSMKFLIEKEIRPALKRYRTKPHEKNTGLTVVERLERAKDLRCLLVRVGDMPKS